MVIEMVMGLARKTLGFEKLKLIAKIRETIPYG
jgi:hypothetical protein